jgi:AraC family transcriptional regulator of adaptative response / DNA-3-methyladenine glycosylase II
VVDGGYRRTLRLPNGAGLLEAKPTVAAGQFEVRLELDDRRDLTYALEQGRLMFDLDADPRAVGEVLSADVVLAPVVAARPGLRVPGHVDGFELAVRAVLGQQVTVSGARTLAARLVRALGTPTAVQPGTLTHLFPTPEVVAEADLSAVGLPAARARALRALASAVASGGLSLKRGGDGERTTRDLTMLPGIGAWTAAYVAMRALGDADAIPLTDLGLRRGLQLLGANVGSGAIAARAEQWRPWRAYGVMHVWAHLAASRPGPRSSRAPENS